MADARGVNLWSIEAHALDYLRKADGIPHRREGEATLLELLPPGAPRILDLGTGAGRLIALVKSVRPKANFVALDFSPTMLDLIRAEFGGDPDVNVIQHDFDEKLPPLGEFDAIISSFAIHAARNRFSRCGLLLEVARAGAIRRLEVNVISPAR
jgi:SAM-dependent methyltransferase